jgi:plasmid replication initiation protein
MAMVGLVHVMRNVSNPMMLAMTGFVTRLVADAAATQLAPADAERLSEALERLTSTVAAIIAFGYDKAVVSALFSVTGMPEALVRRLRDQEVSKALKIAREELARG